MKTCLRASVPGGKSAVTVDAKLGVIYNVALMTVGRALGHPFQISPDTVNDFVALANAQPEGVKSRFNHPKIMETPDGRQSVADDFGTMVGRIKNVRNVGNQARGDIYLGDYAASLPVLGDVRTYLLDMAANDPAALGMSAFFSYELGDPPMDGMGNVTGLPTARITQLDAVDFVGQAASNRQGLLSAGPDSGWPDPNPQEPEYAPLPVSTPDDDQLRALSDDQFDLLSSVCNGVKNVGADALQYSDDDNAVIGTMSQAQKQLLDRAADGDDDVHGAVARERLRRMQSGGPGGNLRRAMSAMSDEMLVTCIGALDRWQINPLSREEVCRLSTGWGGRQREILTMCSIGHHVYKRRIAAESMRRGMMVSL